MVKSTNVTYKTNALSKVRRMIIRLFLLFVAFGYIVFIIFSTAILNGASI